MSSIQYQSLSDDEFERAVYMAMGNAGALPPEVAQELAVRNANNGRDWEKVKAQSNPKQLPLPFNE